MMRITFCYIIRQVEIWILCGREYDNQLDLIGITCILRAYAGVKSRTKPAIPISKEQSLLSSPIAVGLQVCFGEICNCNNLEKRGARPLHFRCLFSTFVENIQNYGSVTLFLCGERRKFKHNRENKWHCPLVVSSRYRRGVVAYFIYWVSYDLSH